MATENKLRGLYSHTSSRFTALSLAFYLWAAGIHILRMKWLVDGCSARCTHTLYLSISRADANRNNPYYANTTYTRTTQHEHLLSLWLLICDVVKHIFPHQILLLPILHSSKRGLCGYSLSVAVMQLTAFMWTSLEHVYGCITSRLFAFIFHIYLGWVIFNTISFKALHNYNCEALIYLYLHYILSIFS